MPRGVSAAVSILPDTARSVNSFSTRMYSCERQSRDVCIDCRGERARPHGPRPSTDPR